MQAQDCNDGNKLSPWQSCGIGDAPIQRQLLSDLDLNFDKTLKLAQAIRTASNDIKCLQFLEVTEPGKVTTASAQNVHKSSFKYLSTVKKNP